MLKIIYVNPNARAALEEAGLMTDDAILNWNRGDCVVKKNWADMFRAELEGIGTVYAKRYFPQQNRLLGAFRRNLAVREFECSRRMSELGIPQAEPVFAALVVNGIGLVKCGIYIMRQVEDAVSLDTILEQMQQTPDAALLETIADALVTLLETMRRGRFCHWDLKPRNLLISRRDGRVVITPIDARSGKTIRLFRRRACITRDRRFLLRELLLGPLLQKRLRD